MLEFALVSDELARSRFACSALHETVASLRVLADPAAHAMHLPWLRDAAPRVAGLDLTLLRSLVPADGYVPDFLMPPPDSPLPELAAELDRMAATPAAQIQDELAIAFPDGPPPAARGLASDPPAMLHRLREQLAAYFAATLQDHWPTIRALLEADISHRARRLADGGARALFAELHPAVRLKPAGRLELATRYHAPTALDGRGLLLMPSVFAWPSIYAVTDPPWQPTLIYPARGVATVWEPAPDPAPEALARVLGRTRAQLLRALDVPRTGHALAQALDVTPGAVSQHVAALRDARLLATHRDGRHVICRRTSLADQLLAATTPEST
jgi:DNA-binding transcriptional ArsR family regulator